MNRMSKGFCILAQNNSKTDYVKQTYALAKSICKYNPDAKVSVVTNDEVPDSYKNVFDKIIPIPWTDQANDSDWKIENRWKVYHCTPYDRTIVMDCDMLVLENIEHWWDYLEKRKVFFVSSVETYRQKQITNRYYRKVFDSNDLPDIYSAVYYFEKGKYAQEFFYLVELIMENWELFYGKFAGVDYQKWCSFDVSVAIASKLFCNSNEITHKDSFIKFTHMKPRLQNWQQNFSRWTPILESYINKQGNLIVGNFKQTGVFHYVEDDFLTNDILEKL